MKAATGLICKLCLNQQAAALQWKVLQAPQCRTRAQRCILRAAPVLSIAAPVQSATGRESRVRQLPDDSQKTTSAVERKALRKKLLVSVPHALLLFAPATFSPGLAAAALVWYACMAAGMTLIYHRMLAHRGWESPKWLEYLGAYTASMAQHNDPMDWVRDHRHHHAHSDELLDLHSPKYGFSYAYVTRWGDERGRLKKLHGRSLVADMQKQAFYRHMNRWYPLHILAKHAVLWTFGGWPAIVWLGGVSNVVLVHALSLMITVAHMFGEAPFHAEDQSKNNWLLAMFTAGEGFHNNHHAFPFSARIGLMRHQFDLGYAVIRALERCGLAWHVRVPTREQISEHAVSQEVMHKLAFEPEE